MEVTVGIRPIPVLEMRMALEILMDPTDHNTLIAATDDGIWKRSDAGAHWVNKFSGDHFTDMIYKPHSNGRVIYACSFDDCYALHADQWGNLDAHHRRAVFTPLVQPVAKVCPVDWVFQRQIVTFCMWRW
jgi:hypothetical protein